MAGYIANIEILYPSAGCIYGNFYPDVPLSRIQNLHRLKFTNMMNMEDLQSIAKSGASYVILHKNLLREMSHAPVTKEYSLNSPDLFRNDVYMPVIRLSHIYRQNFGEPVFEDRNIVAFKI